jgi:hypothetical protein
MIDENSWIIQWILVEASQKATSLNNDGNHIINQTRPSSLVIPTINFLHEHN